MRRLNGVALLTTVLLVAICGCGPADAGGRDAEQVRRDLQRTYEQTWGDPRSRHAAEVLAWVEHEEELGTCLAARGSGYRPAPFVDATAADPGPLSWYDALLPAAGEGEALAPADRLPVEVPPTRTWPGREPTAADLDACLAGPPEAAALDPGLDDDLYRLVTDVLGPRTQVEGYRECLRDNGFDAARRDELVGALLGERTADGRPGPRERDAVVADAACRADAHTEAMAVLDEPLARFRRDHAEELSASAERAEELRSRARDAAERMGLAVTWW